MSLVGFLVTQCFIFSRIEGIRNNHHQVYILWQYYNSYVIMSINISIVILLSWFLFFSRWSVVIWGIKIVHELICAWTNCFIYFYILHKFAIKKLWLLTHVIKRTLMIFFCSYKRYEFMFLKNVRLILINDIFVWIIQFRPIYVINRR